MLARIPFRLIYLILCPLLEEKKTDASDPDGRHIPTCMVVDGAFKYDQYESTSVSYCVDVKTVRDITSLATWQSWPLQ